MELTSWLLPLFISIYIIYIAKQIKRRTRKPPLPPGPRPLPLFGNLFAVGDQPHRRLADLAKVHGPIVTLRLGLNTTIVISSPELAKEALAKKDHLLSDRWVPEAAQVLNHPQWSILWSPVNQNWKQLRGICNTNLFNGRSIEGSKGLRQEKVRELVGFFRAQAGRPVDIGKAVFSTALDMISIICFSVDGEKLRSKYGDGFRDLVSTITEESGKPNLNDFFPFLSILDLQGRRRLAIHRAETIYRIFDELTDMRMSSRSAGTAGNDGDFLDSILQLCSESKFEQRAIKSLLSDLFIAGTDTTSITIEWAMTELLRKPETLAKAQAELKEKIGLNKEVDESDIQRLPYLQAVVKEVLRLHPAAPLLLPHKAAEDVELGGYLIPKGVRVLVNVWAIGHDENVWSEPEVFKPERFLEKEFDYRGRDFEYLPFGSGRRACPGLPLAARTIPLILGSLLNSFEWRLEDGMEPHNVDMKEKFGVTLAKAVPFKAIAIPFAN